MGLSRALCAILSTIFFSSDAIADDCAPTFGVPAGFEEEIAPRSTEIAVYVGEAWIGTFGAELSPYSILVLDPHSLASSVRDIKQERISELAAELGKRICFSDQKAENQVRIHYNPRFNRLNITVPSSFYSSKGLPKKGALVAPGQLSLLSSVRANAAGDDRSHDSSSVWVDSTVAMGNDSLSVYAAHSDVAGAVTPSIYLRSIRENWYVEASRIGELIGGGLEGLGVIRTAPAVAYEFRISTGNYDERQDPFSSGLNVILGQRSRVSVSKDNYLLFSGTLDSGVAAVDDRFFPSGTYTVDVEVRSAEDGALLESYKAIYAKTSAISAADSDKLSFSISRLVDLQLEDNSRDVVRLFQRTPVSTSGSLFYLLSAYNDGKADLELGGSYFGAFFEGRVSMLLHESGSHFKGDFSLSREKLRANFSTTTSLSESNAPPGVYGESATYGYANISYQLSKTLSVSTSLTRGGIKQESMSLNWLISPSQGGSVLSTLELGNSELGGRLVKAGVQYHFRRRAVSATARADVRAVQRSEATSSAVDVTFSPFFKSNDVYGKDRIKIGLNEVSDDHSSRSIYSLDATHHEPTGMVSASMSRSSDLLLYNGNLSFAVGANKDGVALGAPVNTRDGSMLLVKFLDSPVAVDVEKVVRLGSQEYRIGDMPILISTSKSAGRLSAYVRARDAKSALGYVIREEASPTMLGYLRGSVQSAVFRVSKTRIVEGRLIKDSCDPSESESCYYSNIPITSDLGGEFLAFTAEDGSFQAVVPEDHQIKAAGLHCRFQSDAGNEATFGVLYLGDVPCSRGVAIEIGSLEQNR